MARVRSIAASGIVGVVLILNQFGEMLDGLVGASWVHPLTEPNEHLAGVGVVDVLVLFALLVAWTLHRLRGTPLRRAFALGLRDGVLAPPAVAVVGLAVYLVLKVAWGILVWVVGIMAAIGSWLATPFVWLYDVLVLPVLAFIAPPFVWLYDVLLKPVLVFLGEWIVWPVLKWVVLPVMALILAASMSGVLALPFVVVGKAFLADLRTAWVGRPDPSEAYGHGITMGLIAWGLLLSIGLEKAGLAGEQPSVALMAGLGRADESNLP